MKVVIFMSPKFLNGILRGIFGTKKRIHKRKTDAKCIGFKTLSLNRIYVFTSGEC